MNKRKVYEYQMLTRVVDFGATYLEQFPPTSKAAELLDSIRSAVTKLSGHASLQVSGDGAIRTSARAKLAARKALKSKLNLIDQTARSLKIEKFWMPRKSNDQAYIDAGRSFASDAEPLKHEFIDQGLPEGFIDELHAAVRDLERALLDQTGSKQTRAHAIAGFNDVLGQARADLKRFDSLVTNVFNGNKAIMAAWNIARRAGRPSAPKQQFQVAQGPGT
jgi:hypothetical protein